MATEIERRFLIDDPGEAISAAPSEPIEQGYLAIDGETQVRVRRRADVHTLTVKRGGGERRFEQELELNRDQFDALWPLTEGRRVLKRRYLVAAERTIEVDVFAGALDGLVIAEVEFESPDAARAFQPPPWFGDEVTGLPAYSNVSLAVAGRPSR